MYVCAEARETGYDESAYPKGMSLCSTPCEIMIPDFRSDANF